MNLLFGAILGAIILLLSMYALFLRNKISGMKEMSAPLVQQNEMLFKANSKLLDDNARMATELANLQAMAKREYVIGLTDQQVASLAAQINNVRSQHEYKM